MMTPKGKRQETEDGEGNPDNKRDRDRTKDTNSTTTKTDAMKTKLTYDDTDELTRRMTDALTRRVDMESIINQCKLMRDPLCGQMETVVDDDRINEDV